MPKPRDLPPSYLSGDAAEDNSLLRCEEPIPAQLGNSRKVGSPRRRKRLVLHGGGPESCSSSIPHLSHFSTREEGSSLQFWTRHGVNGGGGGVHRAGGGGHCFWLFWHF